MTPLLSYVLSMPYLVTDVWDANKKSKHRLTVDGMILNGLETLSSVVTNTSMGETLHLRLRAIPVHQIASLENEIPHDAMTDGHVETPARMTWEDCQSATSPFTPSRKGAFERKYSDRLQAKVRSVGKLRTMPTRCHFHTPIRLASRAYQFVPFIESQVQKCRLPRVALFCSD